MIKYFGKFISNIIFIYERIKDKTIKKEGILSSENYTINFEFYEKFNKWNTYDYILVGFIHIDTEKV